MNVTIVSREGIQKRILSGFPDNVAVISFYDPVSKNTVKDYRPVDYSQVTDRVFYVSIHDIDKSVLPEFGLSYNTYFPEADSLAEFICEAEQDGLDIICQCEYGESRSAGCAAAIEEYFNQKGLDIFTDYRYYPNQMIYHKVYDALEEHNH